MYVSTYLSTYLTKINKKEKEATDLKKNKVGRIFERAWREEKKR